MLIKVYHYLVTIMRVTGDYEFQHLEDFDDPALGYHSVVNSMELDDLENDWGEESWQKWNSPRLYKQTWDEDENGDYLRNADYGKFDNLIVDNLAAINASAGVSNAVSFRFSDDKDLGSIIELRKLIGMQNNGDFHIKAKKDGVYFQDISTPADTAKAIDRSIEKDIDLYIPENVAYLPQNSAENKGMLDQECRRENGAKLLADLTRHAEIIDGYQLDMDTLEGTTAVIADLKTRQEEINQNYEGDIWTAPGKIIYSSLTNY